MKPRDVQASLIGGTTVLRSRTGSDSSLSGILCNGDCQFYLIQADKTAVRSAWESLPDLPAQLRCIDLQQLDYVILGHVSQSVTLKALLELAPHVTFVCSKPGAVALRAAFPEQG